MQVRLIGIILFQEFFRYEVWSIRQAVFSSIKHETH